jgi:hypothetical protein
MPTALEISILETLALLDGAFREFAEGVADDRYAVWLGAGISVGKLPGLEELAEAVLEHLRVRIDLAAADCRWRNSIDRILGLIGLTDGEWKAIDYTRSVAAWPDLLAIRKRLVAQYARMLDQTPMGERGDYLVWMAVEVVRRYADPAITPGAEHLGLAALILEGAVSDIASANWDPLVERAVKLLAGTGHIVLQPRILPADVQVQDSTARARIYKFHGCAELAGANEAVYRARLVARASQIHGWADKPENKVIAGKLLDLVISKQTLMLGLSAQDTNIQEIFVKAQVHLPATFPTHPPAVVLSEDRVGVDQRSLLRNFYKDDYDDNAQAIEESALLRAYAQSLLPALWLYVIYAKMSAFLGPAVPALPGGELDALREALKLLRDACAAAAIHGQHEEFMLRALAIAGRAISLFRDGRALLPGGGIYSPVTDTPVQRSVANPILPSSGVAQFALGLALLGRGQGEGFWTCAINDPSDLKSGTVSVAGHTRTAEVFFVATAQAAARLVQAGHAAEDDEVVVLHSDEIIAPAPRSPTAPPGRTAKVRRHEFSVSSVADGALTLDALMRRFKAEMAL